MGRDGLGTLMERWVNDPSFREEVKKDAVGVARKNGIELSADEEAALRSIDWNLSDEELQARVSKL